MPENGSLLKWGILQLLLGFDSKGLAWSLQRLRVLFWGRQIWFQMLGCWDFCWINFFLLLEEARKRPVWFGKQGGSLDLSTRELQRDDKVAGFSGWVGRAVRKPRFESVASLSVKVGQRWPELFISQMSLLDCPLVKDLGVPEVFCRACSWKVLDKKKRFNFKVLFLITSLFPVLHLRMLKTRVVVANLFGW